MLSKLTSPHYNVATYSKTQNRYRDHASNQTALCYFFKNHFCVLFCGLPSLPTAYVSPQHKGYHIIRKGGLSHPSSSSCKCRLFQKQRLYAQDLTSFLAIPPSTSCMKAYTCSPPIFPATQPAYCPYLLHLNSTRRLTCN